MSRDIKNWGFPRWGAYGKETDPISVRTCDYHGCNDKADCPAPKAPNSPEKWWFCPKHAEEYNKNWNFFSGMSKAEAERYAKEEMGEADAYSKSDAYTWGGAAGDNGFSKVEVEAFDVLEMDPVDDLGVVKKAYRKLAKKYHPDHNQGNPEAPQMFARVQAAFELLERRLAGYKPI